MISDLEPGDAYDGIPEIDDAEPADANVPHVDGPGAVEDDGR